MSAFFAMIWNARESQLGDPVERWTAGLMSSGSWRVQTDVPGLRLFLKTSGDACSLSLPAARGAVVGTLFDGARTAAGRLASLPTHADEEIRTKGADHLLSCYWGSYVAFWHGPDGALHALRDPSGEIPCWMARIEGVELLSSEIATVADLTGARLEIDPQFVQAFVLNNYLATPIAGLEGVFELLPGQEILWKDGARREPRWAWNAAEICARPHDMDFETASRDIRRIAERCLADWGTAYRKIAISLSGGLDSSILLGLFGRQSGAAIDALHFVGSDYEAQELALAKLVASRAGLPLVELAYDPNAVCLETVLTTRRFARPTKQVLGMQAQDLIMKAVAEGGADCVVAGDGGDALFLQGALGAHMLDDLLRLRGVNRDLWTVAFDTAVSQQQPVLRVLASAIGSYLRRPRNAHTSRSRHGNRSQSLLVGEAMEAVPDAYFENAWLSGAPDLPPGKLLQLECVIALKDYWSVHGYGETCSELLPYLSQPIVEFALKTPTYILGQGGVDRSLERYAFADVIPRAVACRTGKGMINHQLLTVLANNLTFLKELLLEGRLQKQGWIARSALEQALTRQHVAEGVGLETILNLISAEAWTRSWDR